MAIWHDRNLNAHEHARTNQSLKASGWHVHQFHHRFLSCGKFTVYVFFSKVVSGFSSDSILDRILWILDLICSWFSQVVLYMKYGFYTFAIFLIFVQHNGPGDGHPLRTENQPKTPSNLPAEEASWTWGGLWWIQGQYLNPHIKALGKETTRFKAIQKYLAEQKQKRIYTYLPASSTGVLFEP